MPSQNPVHINVEEIMLESQVEGEEPTAYRGSSWALDTVWLQHKWHK